jgi:uncharacterized protein (DUF433 family)
MFDLIVSDPAILGGKPCIKGTRLSVEFILELLASGGCISQIVESYPELSMGAVEQAIRYAARILGRGAKIKARSRTTLSAISPSPR